MTLAALVIWMASAGALIWPVDTARDFLLAAWWAATAYLVGLCLWRSLRAP